MVPFTGPEAASLSDDKADVLGAFFHFAGEVERSGDYQVRIRVSDVIFGVEPLDIYLSGSQSLLSGGGSLSKLDELYGGLVRTRHALARQLLTLTEVDVE